MKKPAVKMAHAVRNLFLQDVAEMSEKVIRKALMKIKGWPKQPLAPFSYLR